MKRRGSLFIEALISIVIFSVGVLALMSVMTMGLKIINKSGDTIIADQNLVNKVDDYMLSRIISHENTPSGADAQMVSTSVINIGNFNLNYSIYRFTRPEKPAIYFDVLQREK